MVVLQSQHVRWWTTRGHNSLIQYKLSLPPTVGEQKRGGGGVRSIVDKENRQEAGEEIVPGGDTGRSKHESIHHQLAVLDRLLSAIHSSSIKNQHI